ncbi:MAG: PadR family transcriptional regulator [Acidobacteria bacterium]|nr:PadR family transcriptional regulator [Acidobacteriota bacterium]
MVASEQSQAPLGPHLFEILLVLADGSAHGYGIVGAIRERTGSRVVLSTSTLYRGIERLLARGLIAEADGNAEDSSGGPPRKYYRLTSIGRSAAEQEARRLREVAAAAEARFLAPRSSR